MTPYSVNSLICALFASDPFILPKKDDSPKEYELVEIEFSDKKRKKYNMHDDKKYKLVHNGLSIDLNGLVLAPEGMFNKEELKKLNDPAVRFVVLNAYQIAEYDADIVKSCNLKSPFHWESADIVFDKQKNIVVFADRSIISNYPKIYGNVFFYDKTFYDLDIMSDKDAEAAKICVQKYSSVSVIETGNHLIVNASDGCYMIDKKDASFTLVD